jgi:hypothetical protein
VLCGLAAILLTRLYVRIVQRFTPSIEARHPPKPDDAAKPGGIPRWAIAIYALFGVALGYAIVDLESIVEAIGFFVGWLAGCCTLNYLWRRRLYPASPSALDVIDPWLDAQAEPHLPQLRLFGYALSFVLLFGGVAWHALQSGFARTAVVQCGSACAAPGSVHLAAALCGVAAILFVMIYAAVAEALQRALVDSWKHVRPGPPPPRVARWAAVLYALIGIAVFLAIAGFGQPGAAHAPAGDTYMRFSSRAGFRAHLGGEAMLALLLGWWIGGLALLRLFWLRRRAAR